MTAGQQLHIDTTLATLGPPFTYGVPHLSLPDTYGYGTATATWELFERVDATTGESKWCASWRHISNGAYQPEDTFSWTAGRYLPDSTRWQTLGESIAWLTAQTLTDGANADYRLAADFADHRLGG